MTRSELGKLDLDRIASSTVDHLLEGCQVIDPGFRHLYLNDAAVRQTRTTREQLLGRTMMEAFPGIEQTEMFSVLRQCMTERVPRQMVNEFTFPDGSKGFFELRFEPTPGGVVILSLDITEHRRAEEAQRRAMRALSLLSNCNQALVRATDERRFLEDVCRLAIDQGGYRMAWIGMKEANPERSVRPVAHAGPFEGYLDRGGVTWDDTERGQGPIGRAIRTGQPVIGSNFAAAADLEPWRENALRRGLASAIALPLCLKGDCVGTLNIYAGEPDAFDAAERDLLLELALDLAFGLETLRERAEHERVARDALAVKTTLEAALNSMTDAVSISDAEGRFVHFNEAYATFHKFASKKDCPLSCTALWAFLEFFTTARERVPVERHPVARALRGETATGIEYLLWRTDTGESWIGSYNFAPIRDPEGAVVGSVVVRRDITEQKRAEQELLENRAVLADFFDSPGALRAILELDGAVPKPVRLNREFQVAVGQDFPSTASLGKGWPGGAEALGAAAVRCLSEGQPIIVEFDGGEPLGGRWFQATLSSLGPSADRQPRFALAMRDFSERKRLQDLACAQRDLALLLADADTLDAALAACLDAAVEVAGLDAAGVYLIDESTGSLVLKLHRGLSPEFVAAASCLEAGSPHARLVQAGMPVFAPFDALGLPEAPQVASAGLRAFAMVPIHHGGQIVGCLNGASRSRDNLSVHSRRALEMLVATMGNTLARLAAEAKLRDHLDQLEREVSERTRLARESEERLSLITETVEDAFWMADVGLTKMFYISHGYERIWGRSRESLLADPRSFLSAVHPEDLGRVEKVLEAKLHGEPFRHEYRIVRPDGSLRWIHDLGFPVREPGLPVSRYVGVARDITARKAIESELREARLAAEAASQAKSAFLASMSHEIRTPMNAVLGFAQLMLRDSSATATQRQRLEAIARAGNHLLALIDDILQFAKIEAGRLQLYETTFDLRALLGELEVVFRVHAGDKSLRLIFETGELVSRYLVGDESKLRQILTNLIGNAVKFTDSGGVAVRVAERANETGRFLDVEVEDTGPGIAEAELPLLFRKFEQTESGRRTRAGTGLGLAISSELARLMGGDLGVRSRLGEGSVFHLQVPVKAEASEVSRPPAKARRVKTLAAGQPGYRVLVVDDNADNRTFLVALLEATGFDTRQAIDGGPAVEVFESWRPVLVLMDMRMPGMSGAEAIRRIRAAPGGGAVKLLGVSASSFEEDRNEAVAAGADDFLSKPFREEVLFEKMRALLGVEYDYEAEEVAKNVPGVEDEAAGLTMAVTRLPGPLRERLRQATLRADLDAILALLGQAAEHDARGAARLRDLAERFGYQQLLDLLSLEVEGE